MKSYSYVVKTIDCYWDALYLSKLEHEESSKKSTTHLSFTEDLKEALILDLATASSYVTMLNITSKKCEWFFVPTEVNA